MVYIIQNIQTSNYVVETNEHHTFMLHERFTVTVMTTVNRLNNVQRLERLISYSYITQP